ncbi:MAG: hypothetical protein IJ463_00635 [Bacilli bacterium]|nr:hypothetical protein [Bacilli bacterium]
MTRSEELERKKKKYEALKKKTKRTKRFTILMFLMLFAVNAYAWFIYVAESRFDLSAKIVSWDVNFLNDSQEVSEIYENIENVAPGMQPYTKTVNITNNSDFDAEFNYMLTDFQIMGQSALPSNANSMTVDELLTYLSERYPFDFTMVTDSDSIASGEGGQFTINFGWTFEDTSKYYKLTDIYTYNPSFDYYRYSNGSYVLDTSITASNYSQNINSLYLYKDDADSFFGMECHAFVGNTARTCVKYKAYLIVQQIEQ